MTIAHHINDVLRTVRTDARGHRVELVRTFATTPDDLWQACTEPDRLARWFEPVEGQLALAGRYRLTGSGTEGTIERCEPPHALRISWEYEGDRSFVEVSIDPEGEGSQLTIAHEIPEDPHWQEFGPAGAGVGWDESLLSLGLHLATPDRSVAEEASAIAASDPYLDTVTGLWGEAQAAAGEDPDAAQARAARAADAYRGQA